MSWFKRRRDDKEKPGADEEACAFAHARVMIIQDGVGSIELTMFWAAIPRIGEVVQYPDLGGKEMFGLVTHITHQIRSESRTRPYRVLVALEPKEGQEGDFNAKPVFR